MIGYEFLLSKIGMPMPERRKNAHELLLLKPGQLDEIELVVAEAFKMKDAANHDHP